MSDQMSTSAYEDNGEPDGINATLTSPISQDGRPELSKRYLIPARQGRAVRLARGQHLKIINTYGTQVCDLWAFSSSSLREFLSMEHVRPTINRMTPRIGDPLVTNRRRAMLTFLEDTSPGIHDTTIASCDVYRYSLLGVKGYHDNCTDNLRLAVQAIHLRTSEIPAPFNLWMNTPVKSDGTIDWLPTRSKAGDYVVFRAELDCVVVMSACPQDLVPVNGKDCMPADLHFEVSTRKDFQSSAEPLSKGSYPFGFSIVNCILSQGCMSLLGKNDDGTDLQPCSRRGSETEHRRGRMWTQAPSARKAFTAPAYADGESDD